MGKAATLATGCRIVSWLGACAGADGNSSRPGLTKWEIEMLDAVYLAVGLGFLAIALLYVVVCDRL